jgi:hypothetical protein
MVCRAESTQGIEILVDNGIPLPDVDVVDGATGEVIGSSSQLNANPQQFTIDVLVKRQGSTVATVETTQSAEQSATIVDSSSTNYVTLNSKVNTVTTNCDVEPTESVLEPVGCTPKSNKRKVSITEMSPLPTVNGTNECRRKLGRNRTSKAAVLTSSPYKQQLEEDKDKMKNKIGKKSRASSSKATLDQPAIKKRKQSRKRCDEGDLNNWFCKICNECMKESMIQCQQCKSWIHCDCAGVSARTKQFICDFCM